MTYTVEEIFGTPAGVTPVLLGPMAGVNDPVFRQLCLEQGVDLTYTEMVSSKALEYSNTKTQRLLVRAPGEQRVAVQLFGHEPGVMAEQAAAIEQGMEGHLAYIDINSGCPARKIVKKGDGCALMKTPELAAQIVREVKAAVSCPVTVKFRKGYGAADDVAADYARLMQDAGADMVAVHGRTAAQMYRGDADWDVIARVKAAVDIPVVGNGDVTSGAAAVAMRAQTGCDAVMIARAAQGNPWIFAQAKAALAGRPEPEPPTVDQRIEAARRHARLFAARIGERNIVYMRKHAAWYLAGIPGAARARGALNTCVSLADFEAVFDRLQEQAHVFAERQEQAHAAAEQQEQVHAAAERQEQAHAAAER